MKPKNFLKIYWPLLLSFTSGRIIFQTDLWMSSYFGEAATAAFGIPLRIMILDAVAAFAFAPVISVMVSSAKNSREKRIVVKNALCVSMAAGVILAAAGLCIYPALVRWIARDTEVDSMAQAAVFWLTLAVPARLTQFIGSMAIHGMGKGRGLLYLNSFELIFNAALNYLFMFLMGMGFQGCYLGTLIASCVSLIWTLFLLKKELKGEALYSHLNAAWIKKFLTQAASEIGRIASERIVAALALFIFTLGIHSRAQMGAFAVGMEVLFLAFMPLVAAMRTTAILMGAQDEAENKLYQALMPVLKPGLAAVVLLSAAACPLLIKWGPSIYHLSDEAERWWIPFAFCLSVWLPFKFADSLQRGVWQAKQKFKTLSLIEASGQWLILLPILYAGVRLENPWIAWSSFMISDVAISAVIYLLREQNSPFAAAAS